MFGSMRNEFKTAASSQSADNHELLQGEVLRTALGFRTGDAFRAAVRANRIPVPLVKIAGRRGWFARSNDVQQWRSSIVNDFNQAAKGIGP